MGPDDVDYAVPAAVSSSRSRRSWRSGRPGDDGGELWGGRPRALLKAGCWVAAAALAVPLVVPLLAPDEHGADSPDAAVEQLLVGIADLDPVAVVAAVDPEETDDPARAEAAYDRMSGRLLRQGEPPPAEVTRVLAAVEGQVVGGGQDAVTTVATLAALDLDLQGLELAAEPAAEGVARVRLVRGDLGVALDPRRLPDEVSGLGRATYTMRLAEGWRRDRSVPFEPFLVAVERDGRWYVSLEASADALLGTEGGRP